MASPSPLQIDVNFVKALRTQCKPLLLLGARVFYSFDIDWNLIIITYYALIDGCSKDL